MSLFLDKSSDELCYPNIFLGNSRPDDHEVKINYSDLVKSGLRRSERSVAECVDNMIYKLKKVPMQTITNKVGIAVRKHKNSGHVFKAGEFKSHGSINKLIAFDDGYRVLKELRGSPLIGRKRRKTYLS